MNLEEDDCNLRMLAVYSVQAGCLPPCIVWGKSSKTSELNLLVIQSAQPFLLVGMQQGRDGSHVNENYWQQFCLLFV